MLPGIRSVFVVVAPVLATVLMAGLAVGCASAASTAGGDTTVGSVIATTIASSSVSASSAVSRADVGATTQTSHPPADEPRASSEPPTPSTTLPPGVMTFASFTMRFEQLVEREDLEGTLPYSVMAGGETAWLIDAAVPVPVDERRGYRFANGDLVFLFFIGPVSGSSATCEDLAAVLATTAVDRYAQDGRDVGVHVGGSFGYVTVSRDYGDELDRMALWARVAHQKLIDGT